MTHEGHPPHHVRRLPGVVADPTIPLTAIEGQRSLAWADQQNSERPINSIMARCLERAMTLM
jgi:hypothetical protein